MPALETVTILITDLVGSTGLASRLGPAAAEELRQEHFSVLRSAIGDTEGREVKNTGDGLMLAFSSSSAAVDCAIAMQQQLELRNAKAAEQLFVRVGIAAGEASQEDGDYFGMPPTEAARLCDAAAGGQILTSELAKMMAAGRHGDAFTGVGQLELKGLPSPYTAYEVAWEPAQPETLPLPQPLRGVPPLGYVGRQQEREALEGLWREACDGSRRLALLSGEPGIGKTRLSTHTALTCHGEGAVVLFGRCSEELGAPYEPWIEALSHYVEHAPAEVLEAHVERRGGELSRLVPALSRRVESVPEPRASDLETERYLLFGAVLGLLEDAAAHAPLVLILDDLHWADVQSLTLLRHVVAGSVGLPVMLLGTFRDSELDRQHPLTDALAALRREEGVERVPLTGLGPADVVAIMEAAAGHDMDDTGLALGQEIATETDGNPFFVAELLRHLSESGVLTQRDDGRWTLKGPLSEIGLPQSVREVVGRRVERLGDETRGVLTVAAVIGREFDVDLLERVAREEGEELLDLLEGAVESSLLVESGVRPGRFMFAHALINHTLYEEHGMTRRARLHLRIAEALEDMCGPDPGPRLAELAHHWSAATASIDASKAMDYSRRAAERALAELAPEEAMRWFSNGLEMEAQRPERDPGDRCEILIGLGKAQRQSGQAEYRTTLLDAARLAQELDDASRLAEAALANNRGYTSEIGIVDDERVAVLRSAVERVPEQDPRRPRLLSVLAAELSYGGTLEERRSLADDALAAARETGDSTLIALVMIDRFFALWTAETLDERLELVTQLEEVSATLDDPLFRYWAGILRFHVSVESGDAARGRGEPGRCARGERRPGGAVHALARDLAAGLLGDHPRAARGSRRPGRGGRGDGARQRAGRRHGGLHGAGLRPPARAGAHGRARGHPGAGGRGQPWAPGVRDGAVPLLPRERPRSRCRRRAGVGGREGPRPLRAGPHLAHRHDPPRRGRGPVRSGGARPDPVRPDAALRGSARVERCVALGLGIPLPRPDGRLARSGGGGGRALPGGGGGA